MTMIESALAVKLNLMGPSSNLNVQWFGHQTATVSSQRVTLGISGTLHQRFQLHNVRTVRDMNLPMQTVKISSIDDRHGHLRGLPICEYRNAVPQILIGLDSCHLGVAAETRANRGGGSFAACTPLGWIVYGPQSTSSHARILFCREIWTNQNADNRLEKIIEKFHETESFGVKPTNRSMESDEVIRANHLLQTTTARVGDRFQTGLLWRSDDVQLPNSFEMAIRRLESVEKQCRCNPAFGTLYGNQISAYITKGYALLPKLILEPIVLSIYHILVYNLLTNLVN